MLRRIQIIVNISSFDLFTVTFPHIVKLIYLLYYSILLRIAVET